MRLIKVIAGIALSLTLTACTTESELRPFASDGCSLFPDSSIITGDDWCSCCFEHDIAYWKGGTEAEREAADRALQACVVAKTGDELLGFAMYEGVRAGGSPYFYNWYRWGYGWEYGRNYQALTPDAIFEADASISCVLLLAASAHRMASERTSSATTAKPAPASPARAASTAALRARMLV